MATKRMNVLVYSGTTLIVFPPTLRIWRSDGCSLRRLLSPSYAVITVTGEAMIKEPWTASCALLVFPGGADLGYCRTLNGEGNRRISQYVERGGHYLGLCAGGYYGSRRCEFEVGRKHMEVVGNRELAFYPGICRGSAFPGFTYDSEKGTRAAEITVSKTALTNSSLPTTFRSYYNGGGVFVDAPKYHDKGVEVIASYTEDTCVDAGDGRAAVVYCKVEDGAAILTSNHPEFAAVNLDKNADVPGYEKVVNALAEDDQQRTEFLKACLRKLGLEINQEQSPVPSLSRLHLSSELPSSTSELVASLADIISVQDGQEYIEDENDKFYVSRRSAWSPQPLAHALVVSETERVRNEADQDRILDYSKIPKWIVAHDDGSPHIEDTPFFDHLAFFANLRHFQSTSLAEGDAFGKYLLYGEVVTSTNTMLEKNTQLLRHLPTGFTATATVQVAGRGRGSNVWVSPSGSLIFSTVVRHPMSLMPRAPVVFLQYLAAMAIVDGIRDYGNGYERLPIKLKWPNDIYALDPSDPSSKSYVKIGGILVNSHYSLEEYISVVGVGLNATNASPTTSLNALNPPTPFTLEKLLASILTTFSDLYTRFIHTGFDEYLEDLYYKHWLHTNQIVTLENEVGMRVRIKGITRDWGLLLAEELGYEDRATGRIITLQSDSNSFDFFKGLIRSKY